MENVKHADMVTALKKPGQDIADSFNDQTADLLHMAIGISGEAGELLDAIKKNTVYQKVLDRENVIEELGDLEFYMEGLRQNLNISREETLQGNIKKLLTGEKARYKLGKYTDEQAKARADKN